MRIIIPIIALFFVTLQVYSQECYIVKNELLRNDFSNLWTGKTFQGTIGDNNQRIEIHFISASKQNDTTYFVTGKSKVRNNICDFTGQFRLSSIEAVKPECAEPYNSEGIINGKYYLNENRNQEHVGEFSGTLRTMFDKLNGGFVQFPGWYSDEGVNIFIGEWQEYAKKTPKYCSWGLQIPPSKNGDLFKHYDNEFYIFNNKYIDKGWKSYVLANLGSFVTVPKDFETNKTRNSSDFIVFTKEEIEESINKEAIKWWQ